MQRTFAAATVLLGTLVLHPRLAPLSGTFVLHPVEAHHSFAAVYDESKPLTVEGVVWQVEWKNPHVQMVVVGKDGDNGNQRWTFEMGAPMVLIRDFGWTPETVKVGDHITLEGFHARAGGDQAAAVAIVTRTGARLRAVRPFR